MAKKGLAALLGHIKSDDWIHRIIDNHHGRVEPERWVPTDPTIHPSWGGGECTREIELQMLGHRTAVESQSRRRMDNGTWAHERWNKYFEEVGLLLMANVRENMVDPLWSGECDVILQHPGTGRRYIGELKTMNFRRFAKVPPQVPDRYEMMRRIEAVEPKYARQLTQYIVRLKEKYGTEDEGFFLFENTDTQEFKVRYVAPDADIKKRAFGNALEAQKAILAGELIEPPFKRKSLTCRACYRERLCYDLQDGNEDLNRIVKQKLAEASGNERD